MRRVTVLGGCGAFPEPGRACSGFLVEWDGYRLVLDLGYATLPRLLTLCPDGEVDAVVITHEHPDHCIDLHGLFRMHFYGRTRSRTIPLYCPPGVLDRLVGLEPDVDLRAVFTLHELPGEYQVGPLSLTGVALPHYVPDVGVRLRAGRTVLAYTGDTGPDPLLAELGRDADLYIVEATDRPGGGPESSRNLLTAEEAGRWATRAGAKRLMLSHFWPGNNRHQARSAARTTYAGDIVTAEENLTIEFGRAEDPRPAHRLA
ncbi:MBL fold metallo-hydrolase [Cryptosporangium sp. NPDC051539]|uniref:MBL fold metallo-hydrolase n=1 Tax=Cryptosporangium sp. NPDC051539 TaxID=3363962 RepID=UPI0037A106A1